MEKDAARINPHDRPAPRALVSMRGHSRGEETGPVNFGGKASEAMQTQSQSEAPSTTPPEVFVQVSPRIERLRVLHDPRRHLNEDLRRSGTDRKSTRLN